MAVVKGSPQDALVIRQYRPGERTRARLMACAVVLAVGVVGFGAGWFGGAKSLNATSHELESLKQVLQQRELTISDLAQKVGILETGGEVDRQAANGVRETVKALTMQVAGLQEDVSFYKGIMVPGDKPAGLQIGKIAVKPVADGQYRYAVMMTQIATRRGYLSGVMALNVVGTDGGKPRILALNDVNPAVKAGGAKFRFRYFQELSGVITLPDGFTPLRVEVVLQSSGKKPQRVEQTIDWPKGAP